MHLKHRAKLSAASIAILAATIRFANARPAEPAPDRPTIVYEITDLTFAPVNAPLEEPTNPEVVDESKKSPGLFGGSVQSPSKPVDRIVTAIRTLLPEDAKVIPFENNKIYCIAVSAPADAHKSVESFLAQYRETQNRQVSTTIRFLSLNSKLIRKLPPDVRDPILLSMAAEKLPILLNSNLTKAVLDSAYNEAPESPLNKIIRQAPRLTTFANQTSGVIVGSYEFYNSDYTPDKSAAPGTYKEIKSAFFSGIRIKVQANPHPDSSHVSLNLSAHTYHLDHFDRFPFAPADPVLNAPPPQPLSIESPVFTHQKWTGAVSLGPTETALIHMPLEHGEDSNLTFILVSCDTITHHPTNPATTPHQ